MAKATKAAPSTNSVPAEIQGGVVRQGEDGKTTIFPQVVAKIAGLAIREIEGVYKLVPFGASQQVSALAGSMTGSDRRDIGVRVEVGNEEAAVDARIITYYEASIPAIADAVRRNVADRVGSMTGLKVVEVNLDVVDLHFEEEARPEEPQAEPRVH